MTGRLAGRLPVSRARGGPIDIHRDAGHGPPGPNQQLHDGRPVDFRQSSYGAERVAFNEQMEDADLVLAREDIHGNRLSGLRRFG